MSGVCVEEGQTGVRVQAQVPHLVSLGGGRLSTAVTIHPLTQGTTVLGCGKDVDVCVTGQGVEDRHCSIENNCGVLILSTNSQLTTIDGLSVTQPTRLVQGSIIGLGHSTYFRFNHPDQARLIKKSLPDCKSTSILPFSFYQAPGIDGNSPDHHHQESRSRDALTEASHIFQKGYMNGDLMKNGDGAGSPRKSLPSPSYNRDPTPYVPQKPPAGDSFHSTLHNNKTNDYLKSETGNRVMDADQLGLDEILALCSEYEKQIQLERCTKPVQNRIKTNGSLPREKRLNSPSSPAVQHSFSFDTSDLHSLEREKSKDGKKSPAHAYENVMVMSGSPRPRIKTFLHKENFVREHSHESMTNRIPLVLDFASPPPAHKNKENCTNHQPIHNINMQASTNNSPSSRSGTMETRPVNNNGSIERRRRVHKENTCKETSGERPTSIADITASSKYAFLGFDPRDTSMSDETDTPVSEIKEKRYDKNDITKNRPPPSWASPNLDLHGFQDYEILNGDTSIRQNNVDTVNRITNKAALQEQLTSERKLLVKRIGSLKSKVTELERQEEEIVREAEIEEALVCGEIAAQDEKLKYEEKKISLLKERAKECELEMEKCLAQQAESQEHFKLVSESHLAIIDTLEHKIKLCADDVIKAELEESLKDQHELFDVEKRGHELLEFQLMEVEAGWLSKREDLQKELNDAIKRCEERRQKLQTLQRSPLRNINNNNNLELQRIVHLKAIEEGRNRLKTIDEELERLTSTHSKFAFTEEVEYANGVSSWKYVTTSQDDLDRISRITSGAPIDMGSTNSLGRRTIASLQEIERNRQIHLAKQGSLVIQEERQRVEDLKKRAQDEVRAQWHQQRNSNCQSHTSGTSEDSSLEPTRDSGVGSDEVEKIIPSSEDGKNEECQTPIDQMTLSGTPESRPLSEASGCSDDQLAIKLRSKSATNLQRPLTRYLPIKSESLDLRQHIESAGHQVDLCPHVILDSTSCRGYLQKMASRFHSHWNKRWFVFDRVARTLTYYSDKSEKKPRGGAYFQAIEEVYVDHLNTLKSPNPRVTFVVKSSSRAYHLVAPSAEAMRIWVDVIFTGAEGHHQYSPHC